MKKSLVVKGIKIADKVLSEICDHGCYTVGDEAGLSKFIETAMGLCRRASEKVGMKYVLGVSRVAGEDGHLMFCKGLEVEALELLEVGTKPKLEVCSSVLEGECEYVSKEYMVSL